jgi:hypothetical protein
VTKDKGETTSEQPERVRRGGDGAIIGYWFRDDFIPYEEFVRVEALSLIERLRAVPLGEEMPDDLWRELRGKFESYASGLQRRFTVDDVTKSVVRIQILSLEGRVGS